MVSTVHDGSVTTVVLAGVSVAIVVAEGAVGDRDDGVALRLEREGLVEGRNREDLGQGHIECLGNPLEHVARLALAAPPRRTSDAQWHAGGSNRCRTLEPGPYPWRPPHPGTSHISETEFAIRVHKEYGQISNAVNA